MSVAAFLLLYSVAVCLIGPPVLCRLTRQGHAPRYGVAAWLIAIGSVLISWLMAAALVVVDSFSAGEHHAGVVVSCLAVLCELVFGYVGGLPQVLLLAAAAGSAIAVSVVGIRIVCIALRLRERALEHANAVRLVGVHTADDGVYLIDTPERAAYCVSGRPPVIVLTTGALATLNANQLGAVLAHERAHLAGRHHLVVAALRSLVAVFPKIPLMTHGATDVSRMLEMIADDAAARRFGRRTLLSGLMSLSGAAPAGALGAADVAVLTRAERLAVPATSPTRMRARAALTSASTMLASGPLLTLMLMASGTLVCG